MRIMFCGQTKRLHIKYYTNTPNFTCREFRVDKVFQEESSPKPMCFLLILLKLNVFWKSLLEEITDLSFHTLFGWEKVRNVEKSLHHITLVPYDLGLH